MAEVAHVAPKDVAGDPYLHAATVAPHPALRTNGTRDLSEIKLIVLHDTEGPVGVNAARDIATYFASGSAEGSAHLVVDEVSTYRCLPDNVIPWAAPGANTIGFHIEQCGYASWTKEEWLQHDHTLRRAAAKTAQHCKKFGLPAKFVTAAGLEAGEKGITTHAQVSKWIGKTDPGLEHDHTDPGTGWPMPYFIGLVKLYLKEIS